jgi:hypothetical protein
MESNPAMNVNYSRHDHGRARKGRRFETACHSSKERCAPVARIFRPQRESRRLLLATMQVLFPEWRHTSIWPGLFLIAGRRFS